MTNTYLWSPRFFFIVLNRDLFVYCVDTFSPAEKHFNLELGSKVFSLLVLVLQTLSLKNPSDAILSSLSNYVFSRMRPRGLSFYTI